MPSTQYTKMLTPKALQARTDTRPWGGISPIATLEARVDSVAVKFGASFDTCKLVFPNDRFEETAYIIPHTPVRITDEDNNVIFRGFAPKSRNAITVSGDKTTVDLLDYKLMLSKRSSIRGQWYTTKGASIPVGWGMGSGLSAGDDKFKYEKWRSDLHEGSGFLHNVPTVFNRGGVPDCLIDNQITGNPLFYYNDIGQAEDDPWDIDRFESYENDGYYWTWATIIRYIFVHWIKPYNAALAPVELLDSDLTNIRDDIDATLISPIDFSIQGNNPLEAIDNVVKAMPGRWAWWLQYETSKVVIRFKKLARFDTAGDITLTMINREDDTANRKLCNSSANVNEASLERDSTHAVANVIALGGPMKLVTTVKLLPMWRRFAHPTEEGVNVDFENDAELKLWRDWVIHENSDKRGQTQADPIKLTAEQEKRFPTIYRDYAIAVEGELFGQQIVSTDPADEIDEVVLTGDVENEYDDHTHPDPAIPAGATLREFFFEDAQIQRSMSPPEFERYSDKVVVFLYDPLYSFDPDDLNKERKTADGAGAAAADKLKNERRYRWVFPDIDGVGYQIDSKNMIVRFAKPQFRRKSVFSRSDKDAFNNTINALTRLDTGADKKVWARSRDVYVTATFQTDMPSVLSSKVKLGLLESISGAPYTEYLRLQNQEIVVHENAWYPLDWINRDVATPVNSTALMDGHVVGTAIRRCNAFDDYRKYIGEGHIELARALLTWKAAFELEHYKLTCNLPYYEVANTLGQTLSTIVGSGYEEGDLAVYLAGISWSRIGGSNYMTTQYDFVNVYGSNKRSALDFASRAAHKHKKFAVRRIVPQKFNNEKTDGGDLPTL